MEVGRIFQVRQISHDTGLSPALTAAGICDLQTVVSCRFHESRWQLKETVLLDMMVYLLGTLRRTLLNIYLPSDVI